MQLEYLRTFLQVVRLGNFSEAARTLHISQSTVSQQVKEVEAFFGAALLARGRRQTRLTDTGARILPFIHQCLDSLDAARIASQRNAHNVIRISAGLATVESVLPRVIEPYLREYSDSRVVFLAAHSRESIITQVAGCQADIGIIYRDDRPVLKRLEQFDPPGRGEEIHLAAAPDHRWAGGSIRPEELAEERLIMQARTSAVRRIVIEELNKAGLEAVRIDMELDSNEAVKAAVRLGLGVGFLPETSIDGELRNASLGLVQIEGIRFRRHWRVLYREGESDRADLKRLLHHLRTKWPEHVASERNVDAHRRAGMK